jgi:hypothetical protein
VPHPRGGAPPRAVRPRDRVRRRAEGCAPPDTPDASPDCRAPRPGRPARQPGRAGRLHEMVRDQHLTELQIVFHTVAEQPARKFPAFASCRNNPALPAPTRSGELSRKPQPRRQIECRNRLPYQRINRPDLLPRQQLNDEFSHGAPAVSLIPQACTRTFSGSLTWINARVAGAIFNVS